ncbi:uncharacterized protein EI90DRAFT_3063513 [Cantharellus anzutake]|uniref:uncharacterized protein n=1 Tax=Cantharellus anzutake TaxID=1750568 RepID=UPI001903521C|nr:uncharacterized protein EI90DRAFT_3063513 [Cantharellus anzutake]KAF8329185.1 hypothetical protein EI90DRAFT_3063513 [Cantharellus anzutake]
MGRLSFQSSLAHLPIFHGLISCCVRCYPNPSCVIGYTRGKRHRSGCPLRRLEPSAVQDLLCANILRKRG